ncbi:C-C motif chemokine 20-like [Spea bombifrons]|uniref:C-C motif chemokine 20-like n=1 Tax=Spea bombifrons TaxID=233779 RepID=UPI00234A1AFC|nr:C-C motif chemokine 20-like [Spea bombifrons]
MTPSKTMSLLPVLLLAMCIACAAQAFDCCIKYSEQKIPRRLIRSYYIQKSSEVCNTDAIVFKVAYKTSPSGFIDICANPKQKWVKDSVKALKNPLLKRNQRKKFKQAKNKERQNLNN